MYDVHTNRSMLPEESSFFCLAAVCVLFLFFVLLA